MANPYRAETSPSKAPALPDIELVESTETELDPPAHVILHNDDITTFEFVISIMMGVFEFSFPEAVAITQTAHVRGIALVGVYPLEDAKYKVGEAHRRARAAGFPLTLTIETHRDSS